MYCELHCHTYHSMLDGVSSPEALLDRAAALGIEALAVTDHDGLYGAVRFWRAALDRGVRPIIGAEVALAHGSHLTLLAENQLGYSNLSRLLSRGHMAGTKAAPVLSIDDIAQHARGLVCLTGCREGAVAGAVLLNDEGRAKRALGKLADIFGKDRIWVELQRHWQPWDGRLTAGLTAVAQGAGVGVVATNDVHYATPDGYRLHDILAATKRRCSLIEMESGGRERSEVSGFPLPASFSSGEYYLKSPEEMARLFADLPEALAATREIAALCGAWGDGVSLDFSGRRTPAFPRASDSFPQGIPAGETAFSYLHSLCQVGLQSRYSPATPPSVRQLAHELSVIERAGLADYFLIVWDIVRRSRELGIRCQGRGSAASSLVAYLLGITPVDPLKYNLLFERFLSDQTDTMPDIDIDFASDRRDEVVAYIYDRYGNDHAAMVCNVVTYQWRSAVRDVARALGYEAEDLNRVVAAAGETVDVGSHHGFWMMRGPSAELAVAASPQEAAVRRSEAPVEILRIADFALQLIDTPRHLSVHVGGMLITAQPLVEVVPVEHATKPGIVVVEWDKDSVEDAGLIKIDLLCLRTLGMVTEIVQSIGRRHAVYPDLDALPHDDPAVYRLLEEGDVIGCFQVESRAQAQMLPRMKPVCFEDLVVEVSIVRPGPIQGGMVHPYLRRRRGEEVPVYLHPRLEPVLKETLGVILFQEQVIRVAVALANFTPGEADRLRRAMSRNRSSDAMIALRQRFIAGAVDSGVERTVAEEAFHQLEGFATYGFCKSHAAAFALIAYHTIWLKAHYPLEFYCALLNHQPMGFYSPEVVVNDARRHDIRMLRPHVNYSDDACTLEKLEDNPGKRKEGKSELPGDGLRLGLRYLHGLGEAGSDRIIQARGDEAFVDLADFCRRTRLPRPFVSDLVRAGALDGLGGSGEVAAENERRQMLWSLGALQYEEELLVEVPDAPTDLPPLEAGEAFTWDYELLGMSPEDHPMRLLRSRLSRRGVTTAAGLDAQQQGKLVKVAGMVVVRQAPPTAKGHLFITLEDETGLSNLIIRPDLYAECRARLHGAHALLAEGILQKDGKATSLIVRAVEALGDIV